MVVLATYVGFSPALGAFIMGSILAETTKAEKIEKLTSSVKNLFGAIFFVSVGMLIDPQMLLQHALPILAGTLGIIVRQASFCYSWCTCCRAAAENSCAVRNEPVANW